MTAKSIGAATPKRGMARLSGGVFRAAVFALSAVLAFSFYGCKDSSTLVEWVEDPENGILDPDAAPIYQETAQAQPETDRTSTFEDEEDNEEYQEEERPQYAEETTTELSADTLTYSDRATDEDPAATGLEESQEEGESREGISEPSAGDEGEIGDQPVQAGAGGVVDLNNGATMEDLPENVHTVAATGQYALIVQMLCGAGALTGADEEFIASVSQSGAFPGEGVEDLTVVWSGDGSSSASLDLETLTGLLPDCLLVDSSTDGWSADVADAISEAGIDVVIGPELGKPDTPDDSISSAVEMVGRLLKDAECAYDPSAMADLYEQQREAAMEAYLSANGGYSSKMVAGTALSFIYQGTNFRGISTTYLSDARVSTVYIDSWSSATEGVTAARRYNNATLYLDESVVDTSDGVGLSAQATSSNFMLIDYYLQMAGCVNNAYDTAKPVTNSSGTTLPYVIIPGSTDKPLLQALSARQMPSALWYPITGYGISDAWSTVGDADFPAVLVKDESMAASLVSSANKTDGIYNVGQPYDVWVVPSGLAGSWAYGSVESYLLTPWAFGVFRENGDLETASTYADAFTNTFYRTASENVFTNYETKYWAECPTS